MRCFPDVVVSQWFLFRVVFLFLVDVVSIIVLVVTVSLSIASQCYVKVSVICVIFGCFCICSPVGVVCCSQHFVRNWIWCSVFVRIIFFWCNFRCVVLRSFCVASFRSLVCTGGGGGGGYPVLRAAW